MMFKIDSDTIVSRCEELLDKDRRNDHKDRICDIQNMCVRAKKAMCIYVFLSEEDVKLLY